MFSNCDILNMVVEMKKNSIYYIFLFIIPILIFLKFGISIDNDFWFTIAEGKYVLKSGFPYYVPFTIYNGLDFVYQSWGTGVIFYLIYNFFEAYGIIFFVTAIFLVIIYFYYKLCLLISNNNKVISLIITILTMSFLSLGFITTRPQIFTFLNLTLLLYFMESYTKTNNKKYLIPLPLIALFQINIHGMFFFMLLIFMIPYIINYIYLKIRSTDAYRYSLKPIILTMILMLLMGFINPYGIDNLLYVFNSYGQELLEKTIIELQPLSFATLNGKIFISIIILIYILYFISPKIVSKKQLPIRYLLLLFGTTYLAFDTNRGGSLFLIASCFPLAYLYSDLLPDIDFENIFVSYHKTFKLITIFFVTILLATIFITPKNIYPDSREPIEFLLKNFDSKSVRLYTYFDDGSYAVYRGLKCSMDPRAEVFLKKNNHKSDIFKEYYNLQHNKLYYKDYLDKYNFTHLLINKKDSIYFDMKRDSYNYVLLKNFENYQIYIRDDLLNK